MTITARWGGTGKPSYRAKAGFGTDSKSGRRTKLVRRMNASADRYDELITDRDTGEVIQESHQLLSEHLGHGSARARRAPRSSV